MDKCMCWYHMDCMQYYIVWTWVPECEVLEAHTGTYMHIHLRTCRQIQTHTTHMHHMLSIHTHYHLKPKKTLVHAHHRPLSLQWWRSRSDTAHVHSLHPIDILLKSIYSNYTYIAVSIHIVVLGHTLYPSQPILKPGHTCRSDTYSNR